MTSKRDLKRRVRERQERTGESYVTALRQVRTAKPGAVPVVELIDLDEAARALGLGCRAAMVADLRDRVDGAAALAALRDALLATAGDPTLEALHATLLRGEPFPRVPWSRDETRRFVERVRAGIGGALRGGQMLTLAVAGRGGGTVQVLFMLMPTSAPGGSASPPRLTLSGADPETMDPWLSFLVPRGL